jgi:hypothetical protein
LQQAGVVRQGVDHSILSSPSDQGQGLLRTSHGDVVAPSRRITIFTAVTSIPTAIQHSDVAKLEPFGAVR